MIINENDNNWSKHVYIYWQLCIVFFGIVYAHINIYHKLATIGGSHWIIQMVSQATRIPTLFHLVTVVSLKVAIQLCLIWSPNITKFMTPAIYNSCRDSTFTNYYAISKNHPLSFTSWLFTVVGCNQKIPLSWTTINKSPSSESIICFIPEINCWQEKF